MILRKLTDEQMDGYISCLNDRIKDLTVMRDIYEQTLKIRKKYPK